MKNRKLANGLMAAGIVLILSMCILAAGAIRGWFDRPGQSDAVLAKQYGSVDLLRDGVALPAAEGQLLRAGDVLQCRPGAKAEITFRDTVVILTDQAKVTVTGLDPFCLNMEGGLAFISAKDPVTLSFDTEQITLSQAVADLRRQADDARLCVYAGSFKDAEAGQCIHWHGQTRTITTLEAEELNDFTIAQLRRFADRDVCFSAAQLDALEKKRLEELQQILNPTRPSQPTDPTEPTAPPQSDPTEPPPTAPEPTQPMPTAPPEPTKPAPPQTDPTQPKPTQPKPTQPEPTQPEPTQPSPTQPAKGGSCTISIRCDTILSNWENLNPAKAEFVPEDGVILPAVTVQFAPSETVFDVLKRVCDTVGIPLEYSYTPLYGSYYIEGIQNLYEKDCGEVSGWIYLVNGISPSYGCSEYVLQDGDVIAWCFSCEGYGADVGGGVW